MNRYLSGTQPPQPQRKIRPSSGDILHKLKMGERIDNLAQKYYNNPTLAWVITAANPEYDNEFEIPIGSTVRVPQPLQRVWNDWMISDEI